jgi:hypothetical protein
MSTLQPPLSAVCHLPATSLSPAPWIPHYSRLPLRNFSSSSSSSLPTCFELYSFFKFHTTFNEFYSILDQHSSFETHIIMLFDIYGGIANMDWDEVIETPEPDLCLFDESVSLPKCLAQYVTSPRE